MRLIDQNQLINGSSLEVQSRSTMGLGDFQVLAGSTLCRLQIWTDQEWAALANAERPQTFIHAPGLGWVGALPVESLN